MKKISLLFLEAEEMDIFLIKKVLEKSEISFKMTIAANKESFINAISMQRFDVILSDNSISQFSALEAINIIKEKKIDTPVILVTGTVPEEFAIHAMKNGAWDYIVKDRLQRLPAAINSAIERHEAEQERKKYYNEVVAVEALLKEGERLAHLGSWQSDLSGNNAYWSDEQYRILGYNAKEITPSLQCFLDRVHPDDRHQIQHFFSQIKEDGEKEEHECRIITPAGQKKYLCVAQELIKNEAGGPPYFNRFIRDVTLQREAELKLRESEQKYRYLFENNPMPIWVMDVTTFAFLDVNKAALQHYGYSYEEFMSMTALDIRPPEDKERFKNVDRKPNRGLNNNGVWKHMKKDGTIIYVEICTDDIVFDSRRSRLVLVNDISEKVKAEEKLRQSESMLKASQRIAHIGGWKVALNERGESVSHWWSDETYRIFGFNPREIPVNDALFYDMVHPDDRARISKAIDKIKDNQGEYNLVHRIIRKDGTVCVIQEIGEVVRDSMGTPVALEGTLQDITERKKAEELIIKSEANLRTIFNTTSTGYTLVDPDLNVISFSKPTGKFAKEQLKKELREGTPAISYFSEEKQQGIYECLQKALAGETITYEVKYKQADGSEKWYLAAYSPVKDNDRKVLGVLMAITDITERKLFELQEKVIANDLIQRNNDLEQFAYIISHNLRAPVANIIGISNAITEGNLDENDAKEFMEGLKTSVHKLDAVIVDLNNIIQVKHKINQHKEKVNLAQIVNDIKFSLSNFSDSDMVMIITDFNEIDELSTLRSYIYSIFYNLISNSIKYRRTGIAPVIEIKSRKTKEFIEITFKDNSMGIDLEKKGDQIFGLYKRFHQQAAEGKGIGLFMVKTQVETLGGRISVQSKVNQGTEFKIEFGLPDFMN